MGIVGSRNSTEYGRKVANSFAKKISEKGICVVSGMAIGIDGIAHNVAIEEKGKTIAVLGGGFNYIYPPENRWLFHKILENGGCIISEYSPNTKPDTKKFPMRNRIISGLSDAVLVVEAMHRSGSTITAKYAMAKGKPVFSVPNSIYVSTGVGTNRLIQKGAMLVIEPEQIIETIKKKGVKEKDISFKNKRKVQKAEFENGFENNEDKKITKGDGENKDTFQTVPKEYLQIYRVISNEPMHINEIARTLNKSIQEISPIITMMELEEYVYQPQINYFARKEENIDINE